MRPFRSAVAAGVAGVMTAHVMFPEIDERLARDPLPGDPVACCARAWGTTGVIVSDDLEMKAVAKTWRRGRGGRSSRRPPGATSSRSARRRMRRSKPPKPWCASPRPLRCRSWPKPDANDRIRAAQGALPSALRRSRSQGRAPGRRRRRAPGPFPGDRRTQRHPGLSRCRIKPRGLRPGETIGLCAPFGADRARFRGRRASASSRASGFRVVAADGPGPPYAVHGRVGRKAGGRAPRPVRQPRRARDRLRAGRRRERSACCRSSTPARSWPTPSRSSATATSRRSTSSSGRLGLVTVHGPMAGRTLVPGRYHREASSRRCTGEGAPYASEPDDLVTLREGEGRRRSCAVAASRFWRRPRARPGPFGPTTKGRSSSSRTCASGRFASIAC